jgi:carbonic anhydrase/acetyltransferase-like protein (isoleucine patch superfamily)
MRLSHRNATPKVHPSAYVAPSAVISGDVEVGEGSAVLFGAVIAAEGGSIRIGAECVVMENAVVRGTPGNPAVLEDAVLVGPHAHVTGCRVGRGAFVATGASVFNGAVVGAGATIRISGILHVNSVLEAGATVPIGWIAVGDPARCFPPSAHDELWPIQRSMEFTQTVFQRDRSVPSHENIARYARALVRHHSGDEAVSP